MGGLRFLDRSESHVEWLACLVLVPSLIACTAVDGPPPPAPSHPVSIAIVDTGGDPFLLKRDGLLWTNPGESQEPNGVDSDGNGYVDDILGWDFVDDDGDPFDWGGITHPSAEHVFVSHGNAMARLAIAESEGTASVQLLRVVPGDGPVAVRDLVDALQYSANSGTQIVLLALGGTWTEESAEAVVVAASGSPEQVFVVAAGNEGIRIVADSPQAQVCRARSIICVASMDMRDRRIGTWATPSNYGSDVVAIGAFGGPVDSSAASVGLVSRQRAALLMRTHLLGIGTCLVRQDDRGAWLMAGSTTETKRLCPTPNSAETTLELDGTSVAAARVAGALAGRIAATNESGEELLRGFIESSPEADWLKQYVSDGRYLATDS